QKSNDGTGWRSGCFSASIALCSAASLSDFFLNGWPVSSAAPKMRSRSPEGSFTHLRKNQFPVRGSLRELMERSLSHTRDTREQKDGLGERLCGVLCAAVAERRRLKARQYVKPVVADAAFEDRP